MKQLQIIIIIVMDLVHFVQIKDYVMIVHYVIINHSHRILLLPLGVVKMKLVLEVYLKELRRNIGLIVILVILNLNLDYIMFYLVIGALTARKKQKRKC